MDQLVEESIKTAEAKVRTNVPWNYDEPAKQAWHGYSTEDRRWQSIEQGNSTTAATSDGASVSKLALYSWNIDFMLPFADSRMTAAIRHLESLVTKLDEATASVVFLQECVASDLELLANDSWVREHFALTDLGLENWQSGHYGTVTLVCKRLPIASCFRVHYSETRMQRDGLFVDVLLQQKTVRLCNTHLESLAFEPARRPPQMKLVAEYMKDSGVHGAAVAGDFNAIQDFDRKLHEDNGLKDAFLELGGDEYDVEGGHTWGQQAASNKREQFGTTRMDKVFLVGGLRCTRFERFGAGVELEREDERTRIVDLGFDRPWITDHLGVMAVFEVDVD
ncbi:hypothetical protein LTR09_010076 [Extremus antarcticus]|uniref:Endonuclease/exonuclease/phosphatase domain-containing protein n=1 Tax=Extremus antarcticus TaxID=702011 RepID=A0AAJ0DEE5_9PEZI|nr:hypothetical protein LTR09_010076 [Extremus antarcticus]